MHNLAPTLYADRIGNYRVLERLGAGGMGVVYKALDLKLNRTVALKFLAEEGFDPSDRDRLLREARAASALDHANIGTVYGVEDSNDGRLFIVMAFYDGETLAQKLRHGPLSRERTINIACQVARGLHHAHLHGVIHRDIKPSNVILTSDGVAKIVDFGLARRFTPSASTQSGGLSGTLLYMSPEQAMAKPVDARSDIWSLGVMLYQMLTGRLPFSGENAADTLLAILHSPPGPLDDLPEELQLILYRALAKDPLARYRNCAELLREIEKFAPNDRERTASISPRKLHGMVREAAAESARFGRHFTRKYWLPVVLLAVAIAVSGFFGIRHLRKPNATNIVRPIDSIAVLPLANLSGKIEQDYFAENMHEALITQLEQVRVDVRSRTSVLQYKGTTKTLPQIAKELKVDAIIEGSVQQENGRVVISLNLRDADDHPLLPIRMERELRDILSLEREVARQVADEIKVTLTREERQYLASARPVDPAAYEAYLLGESLNHGTSEQRRNAKRYFENAIAIDPTYASAYAGLADFYWAMSELDPREAMPVAKRYAMKALELDPRLAKTHKTLASIYFYADYNWTGADEEFRRALDLLPNFAEGHSMYSVFLAAMGRTEESLAHARRYRELEPTGSRGRIIMGWNLYYGRRYEQALEECQGALEFSPNSPNANECIGMAYLSLGNASAATEACDRALKFSPDPAHRVCLGRAYVLAHRPADARRMLQALLQEQKKIYLPASLVAQLYAALGQKDAAFSWLDRAYEEHDRYLVRLKVDQAFDSLRGDPRFESLLRRVRLP